MTEYRINRFTVVQAPGMDTFEVHIGERWIGTLYRCYTWRRGEISRITWTSISRPLGPPRGRIVSDGHLTALDAAEACWSALLGGPATPKEQP